MPGRESLGRRARIYVVSYLSRKFVLAAVVLAVASVALFKHLVSGGEFVTISALVIGAYKAANVLDGRDGDRR